MPTLLPTRSRPISAAGFTLIELLVVIAIISILASILFPVFARAREQARKSSCASNMRQLGLAVMSYAQDFDEDLPPFSNGLGYKGSLGYGGADGQRWADLILPYIKNTQVFDCPSGDHRLATFSGGQWLDIRTYSYGYVSPSSGAADYGVASRNLAEITDVSQTIMLAEDGRQDDGGDAESIGRIIPSAGDDLAMIASRVNGMRHTGASPGDHAAFAFNAVYVDGHVKWVRLPETFPAQWSLAQD